MKNELTAIHNELCKVETKGESTVIMANCLMYIRQLVQKIEQEQEQAKQPPKGAMPKPVKTDEKAAE